MDVSEKPIFVAPFSGVTPKLSAQLQDLDSIQQVHLQSLHTSSLTWIPTDLTAMLQSFFASLSVIIISELGDKTFIISAIMSMKNSRSLVFIASATALVLMTILSVVLGIAVTIVPKMYTHYCSIVLFLCFGVKMLQEAYNMSDEEADSEFDEVKRSLEEGETASKKESMSNAVENPGADEPIQESATKRCSSSKSMIPLVIKVFTMIFVAEWGDRSQISTVVLAARNDAIGVLAGSLAGHLLCTGLAVIGGRFVADMISVRTSK